MLILARHLIVLFLATSTACSQLQSRPDLAAEFAIDVSTDAPLDQATMASEANHPAHSAFSLLVEGSEAFAARVQSARMAKRSIDVQTYIWHADLTGMFFAHELLQAADRGVRVRLMIDDLDARAKNLGLAALSAHPNIEVRLFNPFASRTGMAGFVMEGIRSFGRVNRRMHNKSWIVDNRVAIVGGRNIGNEYFGASDEVNFVDLEFAMFGPVVRDASASFDRYWNSPSAYPMELLDADAINEAALQTLREALSSRSKEAENSRYAVALREGDAIGRIVEGRRSVEWSANYRFVSDDPVKVTQGKSDATESAVAAKLAPLVRGAEAGVSLISPYFVPGEAGLNLLIEATQIGNTVRVLTNSLAATDVAAVHGGYSRYRAPLLEAGVHIWELKPLLQTATETSLFGSSGSSLHTKAMVVDGNTVFVGSYNIDPRSTWLNCEQGVLVESMELATQIEQIFAVQTAPARAWRVTLEDGEMRWSDDEVSLKSDPQAAWTRRFQAWLTRVLHLEAQL